MKSKMRGGSKASNLVMGTKLVLCDKSEVVNLGPKLDFKTSDVNLYNTTGGGRKKRSKSKSKSKNNKRNMRKSKRNMKKSKRKNKIGGYDSEVGHPGVCSNYNGAGCPPSLSGGYIGSDWRSTLYSRGPVNQPGQDPKQFRMFTQNGEFMSNETLRTGKFMKGGKSNKRKSNKRKSNKRKSNKRKSNKRKLNKRKSNKRK